MFILCQPTEGQGEVASKETPLLLRKGVKIDRYKFARPLKRLLYDSYGIGRPSLNLQISAWDISSGPEIFAFFNRQCVLKISNPFGNRLRTKNLDEIFLVF